MQVSEMKAFLWSNNISCLLASFLPSVFPSVVPFLFSCFLFLPVFILIFFYFSPVSLSPLFSVFILYTSVLHSSPSRQSSQLQFQFSIFVPFCACECMLKLLLPGCFRVCKSSFQSAMNICSEWRIHSLVQLVTTSFSKNEFILIYAKVLFLRKSVSEVCLFLLGSGRLVMRPWNVVT